MVFGHTHMPFCRLAGGRLVVNPGSVGMPYGRAGAHWALLGPGVQLRRTEFDAAAACAQITAESGYPDAAGWADYFVHARATDTEALAAFAPRDGRPVASPPVRPGLRIMTLPERGADGGGHLPWHPGNLRPREVHHLVAGPAGARFSWAMALA